MPYVPIPKFSKHPKRQVPTHPLLQMRKPSLREMKQLVQGHKPRHGRARNEAQMNSQVPTLALLLWVAALLPSTRNDTAGLYQRGAPWRRVPRNFTFVRLASHVSAHAVPLGPGGDKSMYSLGLSHMQALAHSPNHMFTNSSTHSFTDLFVHLSIHSTSPAQIGCTLWGVVRKFKFPGRGIRVKSKSRYSRYALASSGSGEEA